MLSIISTELHLETIALLYILPILQFMHIVYAQSGAQLKVSN